MARSRQVIPTMSMLASLRMLYQAFRLPVELDMEGHGEGLQERKSARNWDLEFLESGTGASFRKSRHRSSSPSDRAPSLAAAKVFHRVPSAKGNPCPAIFSVSFLLLLVDTESILTILARFGNQNEVYSSGQNMGKLIEDPTLVEIGKKYNKNGAQVALAWGIQSGHSVLPKSKTPSRIRENLEGDFKLEQEDLEKISGIDKKLRFNDPSASFGWEFYKDLDGKK